MNDHGRNDAEPQDNALPNEDKGLQPPADNPANVDSGKSSAGSITGTSDGSSMTAAVQIWLDRALHFLSHASNETLGACVIGLGASTYLVLGRVGLVLIGVVGGIALHATWEGSAGGSDDQVVTKDRESRRRKELGLEVVDRVWRWKGGHAQGEESEDLDKQEVQVISGKQLDFSAFEPETATALDTFTTAIIRDYVKYETSRHPFLHTY